MSFITELYGQVGSRGKHRVRKEALSKSLKGSAGNHSRQNAAINSFRDWLMGRVVFAARHGFFQVERRTRLRQDYGVPSSDAATVLRSRPAFAKASAWQARLPLPAVA